MGSRGVLTHKSEDLESLDSFFVLDSFAENAVDSVGAGDALLAYSTLAMLVKSSIECATIIGSIAAAAECEKYGNIPIAAGLVLSKLNHIEKQTQYQPLDGENIPLQ